MRFFLLCSLVLFIALSAAVKGNAQNFAGQWRGSFSSLNSFEKDEYVLELEITNQTQVSGYSYTYFDDYYGKRYFTICKLTGTIDLKSQTVTVTETEKIKGDVPPGNIDCLQTHILTYYKSDSGEVLEGKWKPAPGFDHGCGSGSTKLTRKLLVRVPPSKAGTGSPKVSSAPKKGISTPKTGTDAPKTTSLPKTSSGKSRSNASGLENHALATTPTHKDSTTHKPPIVPPVPGSSKSPGTTAKTGSGGTSKASSGAPAKMRSTPKADSSSAAKSGTAKGAPASKPAPPKTNDLGQVQSSPSQLAAPQVNPTPITPPPAEVRQRTDKLIQTIDITSPDIQIELYDDGVIDHDTVTVYFNGKAVVYKNMLSHKPIKVSLKALPDQENELILFADNLGEIPPNTALMVVHAGEDTYDVRVSTDLSNNGVIRFRLKAKM